MLGIGIESTFTFYCIPPTDTFFIIIVLSQCCDGNFFYSRLGCLLRENATSMRVQSTHKALDYLGHGIEKQVSGLITRLVAKLIFIPWKAILAGTCILVEFCRNWFIRKHQVSHHWDVHWQQFRGTWGIRGHSRSGQVYFSFFRQRYQDAYLWMFYGLLLRVWEKT